MAKASRWFVLAWLNSLAFAFALAWIGERCSAAMFCLFSLAMGLSALATWEE